MNDSYSLSVLPEKKYCPSNLQSNFTHSSSIINKRNRDWRCSIFQQTSLCINTKRLITKIFFLIPSFFFYILLHSLIVVMCSYYCACFTFFFRVAFAKHTDTMFALMSVPESRPERTRKARQQTRNKKNKKKEKSAEPALTLSVFFHSHWMLWKMENVSCFCAYHSLGLFADALITW